MNKTITITKEDIDSSIIKTKGRISELNYYCYNCLLAVALQRELDFNQIRVAINQLGRPVAEMYNLFDTNITTVIQLPINLVSIINSFDRKRYEEIKVPLSFSIEIPEEIKNV